MSKFDYGAFGYSACASDMFVAHAGKYSREETLGLCVEEYSHRFNEDLRKPTILDVEMLYCAFRFGVSPEWPDGCYTLFGKYQRGAFPVHVIDFAKLKAKEGLKC